MFLALVIFRGVFADFFLSRFSFGCLIMPLFFTNSLFVDKNMSYPVDVGLAFSLSDCPSDTLSYLYFFSDDVIGYVTNIDYRLN